MELALPAEDAGDEGGDLGALDVGAGLELAGAVDPGRVDDPEGGEEGDGLPVLGLRPPRSEKVGVATNVALRVWALVTVMVSGLA